MPDSSPPSTTEVASPGKRRLQLPPALRYRSFRNYWLALLASVTGYQMLVNFSLLWLIYDITHDARFEGYVGLSIAIPAIGLNLFGGVFADRLDPRRLVGIAQFLTATVAVTLAVLVMTGMVNQWHVLAAAFLFGSTQAFDTPSRQSIWPRLVGREALPNAVALNSVIWTGTRIVAPTIAGIIIGRINIAAAVLVSATGFYILSVVVQTLKLPPSDRIAGSVFQQMLAGFAFIKENPVFMYLIGMTFFNGMFGMSYIFLMPVFAKEVLDVGAEKTGWLLGASGAGALTGTLIAANMGSRLCDAKPLMGGSILFALFLMAFGVVTHFGSYELGLLVLFFAGCSNNIYLMSVMVNLQTRVPDRFRGRVMGFYTITWSMTALGAFQASFFAHYISPPAAVAIGGALVIAFVLGPALVNKEIRSLTPLPKE